ncbi:MAG: hypothetical protein ACHWZW_02710 [Spirulina sp.]
MNDADVHTMIAALRLWQEMGGPRGQIPELTAIATNDGTSPLCTDDEVDDMIERLNMGPNLIEVAIQDCHISDHFLLVPLQIDG